MDGSDRMLDDDCGIHGRTVASGAKGVCYHVEFLRRYFRGRKESGAKNVVITRTCNFDISLK